MLASASEFVRRGQEDPPFSTHLELCMMLGRSASAIRGNELTVFYSFV
jgi:hypothetical protein